METPNFVYAVLDVEDGGEKFAVMYLSEKDFFGGCLQDEYSFEVKQYLNSVLKPFGFFETSESMYSCGGKTATEVTAILSGLPNFSYRNEIEDMIKSDWM